MSATVILAAAAAVIVASFTIFALYFMRVERRARVDLERAKKEAREREKNAAKTTAEANAKKAQLQSGNDRADFDAGLNVLHDYVKD